MTILAIAMQYVNYPTKTLNESTRVIFTMLFGILLFEETIWHSRLWHRGVNGGRIGHVHACRFQIIGVGRYHHVNNLTTHYYVMGQLVI